MKPGTVNKVKGSEIYGDFVGHDKVTNIIMFQDKEREFVVTHNADIKPVSYFTGRETELKDLRQRIEEGRKSVLVSGMGGIGKTHICRKLFEEYLNKHAKGENIPFCHIGYIEYSGDMGSSLQNCLKYKQQDNPKQNQEAAWRELKYLASGGKLLLFVDNVNVPIGEDAGLGRLKQIPGAVVLTSRRTSFSKEFEPYKIGFLSTEQCKKIYERIRYEDSGDNVPEEEILDLEYIIENMAAGHTITVEFLAHLAYTKSWSVKRLHEELQSNGFRLQYKDEEDKLVNIQKSYEVLYDMSALTKAEQNILEAFSVFPYIPLSAERCNRWLLSDAEVSEDDDILIGLYRKGWLQFDIEQESYAMHPVFAKFIYERCKPKLEGHRELIEKCFDIYYWNYISFIENIAEKIEMGMTIEHARFMYNFAFVSKDMGEYNRAEELYKKCIQINEKILGKEHHVTIISYERLTFVYMRQGKYEEAEVAYKKYKQIVEKILIEPCLAKLISYGNRAFVYERQGKYEEAGVLNEISIQILAKILGQEHLNIASAYAWLADMRFDYWKVEELYKKCIRIREKVLGEQHADTISSYYHLAFFYGLQGMEDEAEELYKKCTQINEKTFGEEYLDTVTIDNNLARVYED